MTQDLVETTDSAETTQAVATPTTPVPATPKTFTEVDLQAAAEKARREAQSTSDRAMAKVHRTYQQQLHARTQAGQQAVADAGGDPAQWEKGLTVWEQSQAYQQMQGEQAQMAEWNGYVSTAAINAGLKADDPRLANATDAVDLTTKIAKAVKEDTRKEIEAERLAARAADTAAVQAKIDNGDLTVLGSGGAASPTISAADIESINTELLTLMREPTKNKTRIAALRAKRDKLKG